MEAMTATVSIPPLSRLVLEEQGEEAQLAATPSPAVRTLDSGRSVLSPAAAAAALGVAFPVLGGVSRFLGGEKGKPYAKQ